MRPTLQRLLVLHDRPDELRDVLGPLPLAVRWAQRADGVEAALAEHRPDVVFSLKHSGLPGPAHAPAARCPSLRWLHVAGSGYEHFAPLPSGLVVTNCAGVLAPFLAETAMAALLSLTSGLPRYAEQQRAQRWRPHRFSGLAGRRVLIVGVGAVGEAFAQRVTAFGADVVGIRRSGRPTAAVPAMHGPGELMALLPTADVVALHPRLTVATSGLIGAAELAAMKPGALLLNSSRGGVVDTDALVVALHSRLGGAWLDVTDPEPLPPGHPLWTAPNTLVTPHAADQVTDFPHRFARRFVENLGRWGRGEALVGRVSAP